MKRLVGLFSLIWQCAFGQGIAPGFNYQGSLFDPDANLGSGAPITGVVDVRFRLYDDGIGGSLVWGRQFPVALNAEGQFNILVSDAGQFVPGAPTNSLAAAFAENPALYLTMQVVGNGDEISPRQQLISAPYALRAGTSDTAVDTVRASAAGAILVGTGVNGFTIEQLSNGSVIRLDSTLVEMDSNIVLNVGTSDPVQVGGRLRYTGSMFGPFEPRAAGTHTESLDGFIYTESTGNDVSIDQSFGNQSQVGLEIMYRDQPGLPEAKGSTCVPVRGNVPYTLNSTGPGSATFYFRAIGR